MDALVIGCGLTGAVIARHIAESGKKVTCWDRRDHIAGNCFDYFDEHGFLVQKYGPHTFHANDQRLMDFLNRFGEWVDYKLVCGSTWDDIVSPMPFNFKTIDMLYAPDEAEALKKKLTETYGGKTAPVLEVLRSPDPDISGYAQKLFDNDYAPYTAKQWGLDPSEIDPSVLARVPLRFSYTEGYFDDTFQVMPKESFTAWFEKLLDHPNITVALGVEALDHLEVRDGILLCDDVKVDFPVVFTGAVDELFKFVYGRLPYRSLRFEQKHADEDSLLAYPCVAYPKEPGFTRITEWKKLTLVDGRGTSYALEFPIPYKAENEAQEPYYPILTEESQNIYRQYRELADAVPNLIVCGRLGDFKYYNMDQALDRALQISEECF